MFCAMLGSLFTVLTILLIVQYSCAMHCSDNPDKGRLKRESFDNLYSKALRELVLDNILISKTASQQNQLFERVQSERFQASNREGYIPVYAVGYLPARKYAADEIGRPAFVGSSHNLQYGAGISNNKYLPYVS
jgi:hypothetical protein